MANNKITVTKGSGEEVLFDEMKLINSLARSGASSKVIEAILIEVKALLYPGIKTKEIYKKAFAILRKSSGPYAARYKLKKAVIELGPTGYPFERFIAEILKSQGYKTQVGVIVSGNCVDHEVDVVAENEKERLMIECKFHTDEGRSCDVKVPLYIQSRFKDIESKWLYQGGENNKIYTGCIYTNTRFTKDAIQYGKCIGLKLVSWNYPQNRGLKDLIDLAELHPITCLTSITKQEKEELLLQEKVLCGDLRSDPDVLNLIGISAKRQKVILKEATDICLR